MSREGYPNLKNNDRGRPHALADPAYARLVAEMFVQGKSRVDMAEELNVDRNTVTRWRRDPRVKAVALKLIEDRTLQITRRVDSVIEGRLAHAEKMSTKELLAVRKEYLGGALREQTERADEDTVSEAADFLEKNPSAAKELDDILSGKKPNPVIERGP